MSKFYYKKVLPRYSLVVAIMTCIALAVLGKAFYTMTAGRAYWMAVASQQKRDSVKVMPLRGNILSCDGQLMASSLPEFKMYMDFDALKKAGNDTAFVDSINYIAKGLNRIFPQRSSEMFKQQLIEGFKKLSKHWPIWDDRVDYNTFKEVQELPIFKRKKYQSGFHWEEFNARQRPFGSLAQRTVGDMFGAKDTARCGLELSYDSILRGTTGIKHRRKVLNKFLDIIDTPPIDGADIVTTIDVQMQDLAERAVINELKEINGNVGVAIVMEVKTGDVKAIVNMEKCVDGQYREIKNHAVSDLLEPGSVFKTASIMVALEDGKINKNTRVDTGKGLWPMYGRTMKDHNWTKGGYGTINVTRVLMKSSNIGVSRLIDAAYHDDPDRYVRGLNNLGVGIPLNLPFVGKGEPWVRHPQKKGKHWVNWYATALPWMSIGYEVQLPPVSTLAFYNGIANNGRMMKPRFVTHELKDGQVVREFPTEVIKEKMCSQHTLDVIHEILDSVVMNPEGLGKAAGKNGGRFRVSGKTGTAQIASENGGYHNGPTRYMVSFCGYFPSEKPKYSCIVCIVKTGTPASGGGQCGPVFCEISQYLMTKDMYCDIQGIADTSKVKTPSVANGNPAMAQQVLEMLDSKESLPHTSSADTFRTGVVPDMQGMGARDALQLLQKVGLRGRVSGKGRVVRQSVAPGQKADKGHLVSLTLE